MGILNVRPEAATQWDYLIITTFPCAPPRSLPIVEARQTSLATYRFPGLVTKRLQGGKIRGACSALHAFGPHYRSASICF